MKLFAALRSYAVLSRVADAKVGLITVTGPGENHGLIWDESVCSHRGRHRHSGPSGCRVASGPSAVFNAAAPRWWSDLHRHAAQAAKRVTGRAPVLLARVWELQRRGVLHVHVLTGYSTPAEKAASDAYQAALDRLAERHGFGYVDRKRQVREPRAAAAYLSSYFVAGKQGKLALRESVLNGQMPLSVVYVRPELSQHSGVTMRTLRLRRFLYSRLGSGWADLLSAASINIEEASVLASHNFLRAFVNTVLARAP